VIGFHATGKGYADAGYAEILKEFSHFASEATKIEKVCMNERGGGLQGCMNTKEPHKTVPHYRQGDILLLRVEAIDKKAKPVKVNGPIILAEGEATGHCHAVHDTEGVGFYQHADGRNFLEVARPHAQVLHPEHGPITLPKGSYEVLRQREYDPKESAYVVD